MKNLLFRILLRLLNHDLPDVNVEQRPGVNKWLAALYEDALFHNYVQVRNLDILKKLGNNVDATTYTELMGRRLEIKEFVRLARQSHEAVTKERKSKLATGAATD